MAERARAREAELRRNAEVVKIHDTDAALAHWAVKSEIAATRANRARRLETERKEMDLINLELVTRRRTRLKDLYRELNDRYEVELNARGLAHAKERV